MNVMVASSLALYAAAAGVGALAAVQLSVRRPRTLSYAAAAAFFVVFAAMQAVNALALIAPDLALWFVMPGSVLWPALTPLFWLYVEDLVSETGRSLKPQDLWHALPAVVQTGLVVAFFLLSPADRSRLFGESTGTPSPIAAGVGLALAVTSILWAVQMVAYCVLILRRLFALRPRLRQVFASTEARELGWLRTLMGLALVNVGLTVVYNVGGVELSWSEPAFSTAALFLALALAIWVGRQTPAFTADERGAERVVVPGPPVGGKYERSLLSEDRLDRIAALIAAAFERDRLHLNPNLSLPMLARHIRTSDNSVSQTLSRRLKTNFFEYVNDRRIRDAIPRLIEGEDPIMSVAYDVGFNSRSAFYKAFRSTTGQTPTEFRLTTAGRSHSAPVRERSPSSGLDPL